MADQKDYILGTEKAELTRLGLQHQVWDSEARKGWEIGEFGVGQTILDLGAGPGFCSLELGYIVGSTGKVIAVDKSAFYLDFLREQNKLHQQEIEIVHADFNDLQLAPESLDGVYCRWALAWITNPEEILEKLADALVPGGAMVIQEYYDWSVFQTEPFFPSLDKGIQACLQSFYDSPGEINIGKKLPGLFYDLDMEVISTRAMTKMATPDQITWQWPHTFLNIYLPKLIASDHIDRNTVDRALLELEELSNIPGATILCPQMIEVVAIKP